MKLPSRLWHNWLACLWILLAMTASSACRPGDGGPISLGTSETVAVAPLKTVSTDVVSHGKVIQVLAGQDFQSALNRAAPGDIIELEAGSTFQGPFILPNKADRKNGSGQWITIRSGASARALPPPGVRVAPGDVAAMAILETASGAVIKTAPGAHHYRFVGIFFRPSPAANGNGKALNSLLWLGSKAAKRDAIPHHLIIERCVLRGDPALGTRRGIVMNSAVTAVIDSHLSDFKSRSADSQAIVGWSGPGPYLIQNNYLEAAGENVMFGGGDPALRNLVPADIEVRGNHFAKPTTWRQGNRWTVKNLFELKNARRVLVDGNLFEYNWPQAQNGFAILFTVRNQDGSAPWSVVEGVTFSNNIVRHVARGVNILGFDNNYRSQQTRRIHIRNNLFADLGGDWGGGDLLQLLDGTEFVVFEHNTAVNSGRILISEGRPHQGFMFRNNIVRHNQPGIVGTDSAPGRAALERYFPAAVLQGNVIAGGTAEDFPPGNLFPPSMGDIGFADPESGDYRLQAAEGISAGVDFAELCAALSVSERPSYCPAMVAQQ